jgi:metallo-beta-lactamase family protein
LRLLRNVPYYATFQPAPGVAARFTRAGHIIGSACVTLRTGGTTITFSGDVGRPTDPIMRPPDPLDATDHLIVESTYGDRRHTAELPVDALASVVNETVAAGGALVVPAFAVGRAQHLLHLLAGLKAAGRIADVPVFLDSPMAVEATEIFRQHTDDHRLDREECERMCRGAHYVRTPEESKDVDARSGPMIIVSASGMATGGRVLHHLRRFLPEAKNRVLLVGYQAVGTRGRSLLEGADELKIHGQYVKVRAAIRHVQGLSAHADYVELLAWLRASQLTPRSVFVTHGEPAAADAFRRRLTESFAWKPVLPEMNQTVALE